MLDAAPPEFDAADGAEIAASCFGFRGSSTGLPSERDQNFLLSAEDGGKAILKISNASEQVEVVEMEIAAALHAKRVDPDLPIAMPWRPPDAAASGAAAHHVSFEGPGGDRHLIRVYDFMPGAPLTDPLSLDHDALWEFGRVLARLGKALRGFFHPAAGRPLLWDIQHAAELRPLAVKVADPERRALLGRALDGFEERVLPRWPLLRSQVIHGDLSIDNVTLDGEQRISGIIDFGDMSHTALMADITSAWASVVWSHRGEKLYRAAAALLDGYRTVTPLEEIELEMLADLFAARAAASAAISAVRVAEHPDNTYIAAFDTNAWPLLELLDELGPEEAARRFGARSYSSSASIDELLERRVRNLGPALMAPTYSRPLHLVRGEGVWMSDPEGRRYLDAYNNVPVVGHSHPRVLEALARQARTLNTNMRYLHEAVLELAERVVDSMPADSGLDTVMFVNSGSEANDLAWRIATAHSGDTGGLASDYAYHGISSVIADLSPEGSSAPMPANVDRFPPPDAEGKRPAGGFEAALQRLDDRGVRLAAVLVDGYFTSDGVYPPSSTYLEEIVRLTHEAGALYVADEVQAGHGRSGEHLWSFAASGIRPDIVTLGKPMGNGYPVAALVTRREIVEGLSHLREFFSTFGGNPPAAVTALTVLDVIEDEQLVARAAEVGAILRDGITGLAHSHPAIGAVRGWGQMTGVEIATGDGSTPDPELADRIKNGLREQGVLVGTTGPADNVLKVRPPLVFGAGHAEILLAALGAVLSELS